MSSWKGSDGCSMNRYYLGETDNPKKLEEFRHKVDGINKEMIAEGSGFRYFVKIIRFKNGKVGYYWRETFTPEEHK